MGGVLRLRKRTDLIAVEQRVGPLKRWAVKDPIGLNYFHFRDDEWFLLSQLDGSTTLEDIQRRFEAAFSPKRITKTRLASFFSHLHENGLVLADQFGQSKVHLERAATERQQQFIQTAMNPLAIRLRGVDASGVLKLLAPIGKILFHPATFMLVIVAWIVGAIFLVGQSSTLMQRIPAMSDYLTGTNVFFCLLYTSPSPRDATLSRMPSSA